MEQLISCLLKHLTRTIKSVTVNRRFVSSSINLKTEVVNAVHVKLLCKRWVWNGLHSRMRVVSKRKLRITSEQLRADRDRLHVECFFSSFLNSAKSLFRHFFRKEKWSVIDGFSTMCCSFSFMFFPIKDLALARSLMCRKRCRYVKPTLSK